MAIKPSKNEKSILLAVAIAALFLALHALHVRSSPQSQAARAVWRLHPEGGRIRDVVTCIGDPEENTGFVSGWIEPKQDESGPNAFKSVNPIRFMVDFSHGKITLPVGFDTDGVRGQMAIMRYIQAEQAMRTAQEYPCWDLHEKALSILYGLAPKGKVSN